MHHNVFPRNKEIEITQEDIAYSHVFKVRFFHFVEIKQNHKQTGNRFLISAVIIVCTCGFKSEIFEVSIATMETINDNK